MSPLRDFAFCVLYGLPKYRPSGALHFEFYMIYQVSPLRGFVILLPCEICAFNEKVF